MSEQNPLAVTHAEILGVLRFARSHLYAAQAQMSDRDDPIIARHVYDAYKRISDLASEVERHGIVPEKGGVNETA